MKKLFLFICLITSSTFIFSQNENSVIAWIGDRTITLQDFKQRFELAPQIRNVNVGTEEQKNRILYTLIAEKLWAIEAENTGYDSDDIITHTFKVMEKMLVRDELYKAEILQKAKADFNELINAMLKSNTILNINFIYSINKDEINDIYIQLISSTPFDSILINRPEKQTQLTPIKVTFGSTSQDIEDSIYNLKVGSFTKPIETDNGWLIFRLVSTEDNTPLNNEEFKTREKKLKKIVEDRAISKRYKEFYSEIFKDLIINSDGYLFWSLSDKIIDELNSRREELKVQEGNKVELLSNDFQDIEKLFGEDSLKLIFIKFEENPITLKEFLRDLTFEGFYTNYSNPDIIRQQLNSRVKRFIELEVFYREAIKRGLQYTPNVKSEIELWRDNYLSNLFKIDILNSVEIRTEQVKEYYNENTENIAYTKLVNIIEMLCDSLETIEKVLTELDNGADFRGLAIKYTKRTWVRDNNGEFGFFPTTMYGDVGKIAGELKIGDMYGPLKLEDGYSLFQLIDTKQEKTDNPLPFEEVAQNLEKNLKLEKFNQVASSKTIELAKKYGVQIDRNTFNNLNVVNHQILAYRYFGFGGRTLAVPQVSPFYKWYENWKSENPNVP
ncbi:MAG: peptidylprolyl isomerase [Ignavibacteriales bacterium]|nr:peptidylprolyl isomerase [Ignavibacteriales bacterium]